MTEDDVPEQYRSAYRHFAERLLERYGLTVTPEQWMEINRLIAAGHSIYVETRRGRELHYVAFGDTVIRAVWSAMTKVTITALPRSYGGPLPANGKKGRRKDGPYATSKLVRGKMAARKAR